MQGRSGSGQAISSVKRRRPAPQCGTVLKEPVRARNILSEHARERYSSTTYRQRTQGLELAVGRGPEARVRT
ncbi:hypothetical protein NDU88_008334 [Pleurodeles waltl]|uniref:Uncharacterized protein n=1 Tax=Pleurodeles waltl TaxID=8319 RepID=A0AAV7NYY4_PLEWA|nr:hypothetical protein NDU88_008334 [Pleurodeles waltl]